MSKHIFRPVPSSYNLGRLVQDARDQWPEQFKSINEVSEDGEVATLLFSFEAEALVDEAACDAFLGTHDPELLSDAQQDRAAAREARQALLSVLGSTVGKAYGDLTLDELKALLAGLLWLAGGLDGDTTVRELNKWLKS